MKSEMLMVCLMLLLAVAGSHQQSKEVPRTLCGPKLADAHMLYCYSTKEVQKKSTMLHVLGSLHRFNAAEIWPLIANSRQRALELATRNKRMPGLVDECCYKPCYLSELLSYCET